MVQFQSYEYGFLEMKPLILSFIINTKMLLYISFKKSEPPLFNIMSCKLDFTKKRLRKAHTDAMTNYPCYTCAKSITSSFCALY